MFLCVVGDCTGQGELFGVRDMVIVVGSPEPNIGGAEVIGQFH